MGRINKLADKIRQWKIGGKKLGSDPIQINNNNIFHNTIKDWRCRQMLLFVLCQEHSSDVNYQCWLHWHPVKINKVLEKLST
jgi:hypothetical protein